MAFDPFTGQFRPNVIATIDPLVYKELKDSTSSVAEEADFIRQHVGKDKRHIREIKAKLRDLESKLVELKNIPEKPISEVLDLTSAMEFDLIHAKIDSALSKTENDILDLIKALQEVKLDIDSLKNKKTPSLVSVKIDEEISEKFLELQFRYSVLLDKQQKLEETLKVTDAKMAKYFKTSIWVSIGTTLLLIALKFLI